MFMKHLTFLFFACIALFLPLDEPISSFGVFDPIDTEFAPLWTNIQLNQNAFFVANGQYFQGLETHSIVPPFGTSTAPDRKDQKPTDRLFSWNDFIGLPANMGYSLSIDYLITPNGNKYSANLYTDYNGVIWRKSYFNDGVIIDWQEIPDLPSNFAN